MKKKIIMIIFFSEFRIKIKDLLILISIYSN